jgi:hypothetical protein
MNYCHYCPGNTEKAIFDVIYIHGMIYGNGNRIGVEVFQIEICGYS